VPRLSIIIPVAGNLTSLEDTLLSVLENRPDGAEVLVVLDEPYDDPYELKGEIRFLEAAAGASFVESVNLGISASQAPVVHLLACGCQVTEGWTDQAVAAFDDPAVATVVPLVLTPGESPRVLAAGMTYRPGGVVRTIGRGASPATIVGNPKHPLAAAPVAAFYRKSALELIGLFSHDVADWLATIDLGLALEQAGFHVVLEPECRIVAAHTLKRPIGAFRQALELERLFWRWGPRGGWTVSLAVHGAMIAAEALGGLVTLKPSLVAGRLAGLSRIGSHRRQYQRLAQLRQLSPNGSPTPALPHFLRGSVQPPAASHNGAKSA
jgi:hypothetical protein